MLSLVRSVVEGGRTGGALGLAIALIVVCIVAAGLRWRAAGSDVLFGTDEADYARAMAYGPAAAYLGTHERNGFGFIHSVVSDYRATGWARPFKRDWDSGDAAGLRHYHPPVALYAVAIMMSAGVSDERVLRRVPALTSVLACMATVLLAWLLLPATDVIPRSAAAAAAGLIAALSPFHAQNGVELGAHALFSLTSTLALCAIVCFSQSGARRWWRLAWVCTAVAMLTVPYWALLVPPLAWAGWNARRIVAPRGLVLDAVVSALAALLVAWPPFVLKAGFAKAILMYGGLLIRPLMVAQSSWVVVPSLAHAAILAMLVATLIGVLVSPRVRAVARIGTPVALFVVGFALLNVRVTHLKPLYAGDVIAAAAALSVMAVLILPTRWMAAAAIAVASIMVADAFTITPPPSSDWRAKMAALDRQLAGRQVLVTPRAAGAMMTYYLRDAWVVLDSSDPVDRESIVRQIADHRIDDVLRMGREPEAGGVVRSIPQDSSAAEMMLGTAHVTWWSLK